MRRKFNLDRPDDFQYYWHGKDIRPETFSTRHSVGGSILIFVAISFQGAMELKVIQGNKTAAGYINMLGIGFGTARVSSDLNFIEHFCGQVTREIYRNRCQLQTVHHVREGIFITWNNIPARHLHTLIPTCQSEYFKLFPMTAVQLTNETSCWAFPALFRIYFTYGYTSLITQYLS